MTIRFQCSCGRRLAALDNAAGKRCECLECGKELRIPQQTVRPPRPRTAPTPKPAPTEEAMEITDFHALEITEFLDPPSPPRVSDPGVPAKSVAQRMLESLLDPRAIHWMLILGGGLTVVGLIVWLISLGLFKDPRVMAVVFGSASLGLLGTGWWLTLRTRFHVAGRAISFLACVVLPLNLWFLHAQNLITLDEHLWLGGLLCVGLYAATVYLLRDPLYLYAVQTGVTLTALLLLGDLKLLDDSGCLVLLFGIAGAVSIHVERAFAVEGEFDRRRYGLPLFWSGHVLLLFALMILLGSQSITWLAGSLKFKWQGNWLTNNHWLAGSLWLAATYLYVYSDFVVRRLGFYSYLAGGSLLMAITTLTLPYLNQEGLIAVIACVALGIQLGAQAMLPRDAHWTKHPITVAVVMTQLALLLALVLHIRATSVAIEALGWKYTTGWGYVGAMLVVVVVNRIAAHLSQDDDRRLSEAQFFLSAAGLLLAAAGLLRQWGWIEWSQQAPCMMLIPIGYLVASRLWRGHPPEKPLVHLAHTATVVILCSAFTAAIARGEATFFRPIAQNLQNLLLGLTWVEAAAFYALAAHFRRNGSSIYFAAAACCAALWQFFGYFGIAAAWYTLAFALLGIALLFAARSLGLRQVQVYRPAGGKRYVLRGDGRVLFQCGAALLSIALIVAAIQGLSDLVVTEIEWRDIATHLLTAISAFVALSVVPTAGWRHWFLAAAISVIAIVFLQFQVLLDLSPWRKLELLLIGVGIALLAAGHIGRFREDETRPADGVGLALWLGSFLCTVPLFVVIVAQRAFGDGPSLYDELALVTATVLLVVSGCSWQIKSTTLVAGSHLLLYLLILIGSIAYQPQVAIGVYLLAGGGLIFLAGVVLSMYRERLMSLPERFGRREGLFRVIDWR